MARGGRFAKNNRNARAQERKRAARQDPAQQTAQQASKAPKREKKQSSGVAGALVIIGIVLMLVMGGVAGIMVYQSAMSRMAANKPTVPTLPAQTVPSASATQPVEVLPTETEEAIPETTELPYIPSGQDIINVLVIGDSSREDESAKLADTMILASINKKTKTVTLSSFLRDTYVDLPDYMGHECGWNRINVAYNLGYRWGAQGGALEMTQMTLDLNFGIKVDHNVVVDFDGFMNAINVLGAIPIELTEAEAEYINKTLNKSLGYPAYNYQAVYEDGTTQTHMGGWECLTYARMRKAKGDGDSDIKRTARQRKLIGAIIDKVRNTDINTLMAFAKEIMSQVTTDMTDDEIMSCMWEVLPMLVDLKIEMQQIPAEGTAWSKLVMVGEYETYALEFDSKKNREIMMGIAEADQLPVQPTTETKGK